MDKLESFIWILSVKMHLATAGQKFESTNIYVEFSLRLSLLFLPFDRGGGAPMPQFIWYYWPTQLGTVMFYYAEGNPATWLNIESLSLKLHLLNYIHSDYFNSLKNLHLTQ